MENSDLRKRRYYEKILNRYKNIIDFYTCQQTMMKNMPTNLSYEDSVIYKTSVSVTAPTLISYIIYILEDSKKCGLKRLYFLSRDGYIMYKIAKILCSYYKINIECRYLYVSRRTLRAPLYLIDEEEAMKYFCEGGAKISARVILQRAGISEEFQDKILDELGIEFRDKPLTDDSLNILGEKLRRNKCFVDEALNYAKVNYSGIYEYFFQEGLFDKTNYAIVDTGWIGSMQRHLRQILSYSGMNRIMSGYYFGMFKDGKKEDGKYNCFYFSANFNSSRRVFFNNSLFECMCSANHGMTIGYNKNDKGIIQPIFKDYQRKWNVVLQLQTIEQFVEVFVKINELMNIRIFELPKLVKKLVTSFMVFPNKDEADVYGSIPFCDDSTEGYMISLANVLNKNQLRQYNMFYKVYKKIFLKGRQEKVTGSFWINGTIQLTDISHKKLFNLNCIVCEYIHYVGIKVRNIKNKHQS